MCSDTFMVNWESSFFLDQAAHIAGREAEQNKEKDWVLGQKELLWQRRSKKAAVGKYWKRNHKMMKLQLLITRETEKILQFLGNYSWPTFSCHLCQSRKD